MQRCRQISSDAFGLWIHLECQFACDLFLTWGLLLPLPNRPRQRTSRPSIQPALHLRCHVHPLRHPRCPQLHQRCRRHLSHLPLQQNWCLHWAGQTGTSRPAPAPPNLAPLQRCHGRAAQLAAWWQFPSSGEATHSQHGLLAGTPPHLARAQSRHRCQIRHPKTARPAHHPAHRRHHRHPRWRHHLRHRPGLPLLHRRRHRHHRGCLRRPRRRHRRPPRGAHRLASPLPGRHNCPRQCQGRPGRRPAPSPLPRAACLSRPRPRPMRRRHQSPHRRRQRRPCAPWPRRASPRAP
mmetsp:Transcript_14127/g.41007  ORF Transcript_14127/g.41007 Transcript_14127/m.41007 type:complete len:293 (-) Transcript_14127:729-1607(-)